MEINKKKVIGIICGGVSTEHNISLLSSLFIMDNIDLEKYELKIIIISKTGDWYLYNGDKKYILDDKWFDKKYIKPVTISLLPNKPGFFIINDDKSIKYEKIDIAFPVLHGRNGEDGTIQALFKIANIPYVGCDHVASMICMDKELTHIVLNNANIKTAPYFALTKFEFDNCNFELLEKNLKQKLDYPMFIKPANAGSSFGVNKAHDKSELLNYIIKAFEIDKKIVIEKCIYGKEIECAVIGNNEPFASIVGEISPCNEFYDYDAKYNDDNSLLFVPARISENISNKIRETAKNAFKILGCCGMARIDFFVTEKDDIILNEPNTIPGFTNISMYPKLLMKSGFESKEIINKLIDLAFENFNQNLKYDKIV